MTRATRVRGRQRGFSLLEMLVVVAILMVVMGVIFQQVSQVQKRYRTEEAKVDLTQESREFLDQIVRDLHQTGFPPRKMYASTLDPPFVDPWWNDKRVAVGLVKFSYTELWFEGDVDGDGKVESVRYALVPGPGNACPCTLTRSQYNKVDDSPMSQMTSDSTGLDGVVNSGGAYQLAGSTTFAGGVTKTNDSLYGALEGAQIFTAYDVNGKPVLPTDFNSNPAQLATIKTIAINLNVLVKSTQADLQTQMRPALSLSASAKISN